MNKDDESSQVSEGDAECGNDSWARTIRKGDQGDACQQVQLVPLSSIPLKVHLKMKIVAKIAYDLDTRGLAPLTDCIPVVGDIILTTCNVIAFASMASAVRLNNGRKEELRQKIRQREVELHRATYREMTDTKLEQAITSTVDKEIARMVSSSHRNIFIMAVTILVAALFMMVPVLGPLMLPYIKPTRRIYRRGHKFLAETWDIKGEYKDKNRKHLKPLVDVYGQKHFAYQPPSRLPNGSTFFDSKDLILGRFDRPSFGHNRVIPTPPEDLSNLSKARREEASRLIEAKNKRGPNAGDLVLSMLSGRNNSNNTKSSRKPTRAGSSTAATRVIGGKPANDRPEKPAADKLGRTLSNDSQKTLVNPEPEGEDDGQRPKGKVSQFTEVDVDGPMQYPSRLDTLQNFAANNPDLINAVAKKAGVTYDPASVAQGADAVRTAQGVAKTIKAQKAVGASNMSLAGDLAKSNPKLVKAAARKAGLPEFDPEALGENLEQGADALRTARGAAAAVKAKKGTGQVSRGSSRSKK